MPEDKAAASAAHSLRDLAAALIRGRRSVRRYAPQPVPRETLEALVELATCAPSAHNRQPWRFAIMTGAAQKERVARAMGDKLRADRTRDGDPPESIAADVARSQARITAAPAIVLVGLTLADMDAYPDASRMAAERMMAVQSTAMAIQNLLLAAHAAGLGACWMCAPLFCPDVVREAADLPADFEPQALVTVGYPLGAAPARARRPRREVLRFPEAES